MSEDMPILEADEPESFHGFHPLPRRGGVVTKELVEQILEEEHIEMARWHSMRNARGRLAGIDTDVEREPDRDL